MLKNRFWITSTTCLIMLSMAFSSCKKWLDLKPADGIIVENYWKTKEQINASVIGCYASLLGDPTGKDKSLAELFFLWGELRADMLGTTPATTAEELNVMNVNTVSSSSLVNWRPVYRVINYCNTVIDNAPLVLTTDKTLTQNALDAYIAEAKGLRAMMYFYLVRSFGDVPLKLKSTASDEDIVSIAKSPQATVLAQIEQDLTDAESKILVTYGNNASDKGRLTRYSINTIQADVYLWEEKYSDAITACNKVINSRIFGLVGNSSAWYTTLYRNGNSTESIFEYQFYAQKLNTFFTMFTGTTKRFLAANRVMDQVYTTDNVTNFTDIRADGGSVRAQDGLIWKYVGLNSSTLMGTADSYTHWFVYRYADVLLMKAEALANLNNSTDALVLVRAVRDRAHALAATDENPDPTNKDAVCRFILNERAREFMFEGKRWYDVLRYVKKNNYANIAYLQDLVSNTVAANSVRTAQAKMLDHNSHYFPIYDYELQTNSLLVQNPFYK